MVTIACSDCGTIEALPLTRAGAAAMRALLGQLAGDLAANLGTPTHP